MSSTSNDPAKYFRTGIALNIALKTEFDARLQALGLKTVGDLATLFTKADGVVEALLPVATQFNATKVSRASAGSTKAQALALVKSMSAEQLDALLAQRPVIG